MAVEMGGEGARMKVYIVTRGCYSDYSIEAVFLNKADAEIYIATKTAEISSPWWWDDYNNVEEYETQDGNITTACGQVGHFYWFDVSWGQSLKHQLMFEDDARKKSQYLCERNTPSVWLPKPNKTKAKKILQDRMAEIKARKSGIS